jgi:flagellar basal body-associated protein FliL
MAQNTPNPPEEAAAPVELSAAESKPSILGKVKILLFVIAVIAAECVVAYLYLPSASEAASLASAQLGVRPKPEAAPETTEEAEGQSADHVEVDLGSFTVTAFQPVSNTTLHITFRLYGAVKPQDAKDFGKRMEENQHRFREQVIVTVRSANITDLTDAGLGLVKRTIQDKANRSLGKPYLQAIIFSEFSFIEQ